MNHRCTQIHTDKSCYADIKICVHLCSSVVNLYFSVRSVFSVVNKNFE